MSQLGGPPPFSQPFLDSSGRVSTVWQLWLLAAVIEYALGIGNGANTAIEAPAQGSGSGPANPNLVANWLQFQTSTGELYWIPLFR